MIKRLFIAFILLVLIAAAGLWYAIFMPYKGFEKEVFVDIPTGTGTTGIARMLRENGVIRADWQFLTARALNSKAKLQAGEYRFDRPMSVLDVFRKIARGDVFYYELRVPEGANMFDIAAELEKLGLVKSAEFLKAAQDTSLIHDIAPAAPSLEGYLFPSTYRITRHTTPKQICREMTSQFRKVWKQVGGGTSDVNRTVTLASLVEKETAVPGERPSVASVYHNRLQRGMRLDGDPTVIYAAILEGRYRGTIYRSDLENPSAYNTYRNAGLPPGPIANPGAESLRAALQPAQTDWLYFVAKPDGSGAHNFSNDLASHNLNVQQYRNAAPR